MFRYRTYEQVHNKEEQDYASGGEGPNSLETTCVPVEYCQQGRKTGGGQCFHLQL